MKNPAIPLITVSGTSYRNDVNLIKGQTEWRESGSKEWEYSCCYSIPGYGPDPLFAYFLGQDQSFAIRWKSTWPTNCKPA